MTYSRITGVQGTPANIPTGTPPVPAGGGASCAISASGFPGSLATSSAWQTLGGWFLEEQYGTGLSVETSARQSFNLLAGIYQANLAVVLDFSGTARNAQVGIDTTDGFSEGEPASAWVTRPTSATPSFAGGWTVNGSFWFLMPSDGQAFAQVQMVGETGTTNATFGGIDIVLLSPLPA